MTATLYKYMSLSTAEIVLRNRTLRWSTPSMLNDPFDMQTGLNLNIDEAALIGSAVQKMWEAFSNGNTPIGNKLGVGLAILRLAGINMSREEFDAEFSPTIAESLAKMKARLPMLNVEFLQELSKSKVLCLSEAPDVVPMWSLYADQHKGVVLEFDVPPNVDSPWKSAMPMNYKERVPNLYDESFLSDLLSGRRLTDTETIMNRYIFTKGKDWAYERERRIYSGDGRYPDADFEDVKFHNLELFGIIFGCRLEQNKKGLFADLAIALNPNVSIFETERIGFKLALSKIE